MVSSSLLGRCALIAGATLLALLPNATDVAAQAQHSDPANKSGEIRGVVQVCAPAGPAGAVVHIPGRSFQARLGPSGTFVLNYVPSGTYSLTLEAPNRQPLTIEGVAVAARGVTDVGTINLCRDFDGDGYTEDVDCNDNNASIHPGAAESCDGTDNNCNGQVDEGCTLCTDADLDGYFAQGWCPTAGDCDDSDATVFPGAAEICDGRDNDCDSAVDEGFDLGSDPYNCGQCGNSCSFANAESVCLSGVCIVAGCQEGWLDCDGLSENGCETEGFACPGSLPDGSACVVNRDCASGLCENGVCSPN